MKNYPFRIALIYFVMASLWIFMSDAITEQVVPRDYLTTVQSIKGFGFVIISAIILFLVSRNYYRLIRKNEQEYRRLFKDNPHPMYVFDTETLKFLTVNDAAVEKYKYSHEEFRKLSITDIRPESERESIIMFLKRIEEKPYHESGIWKHTDKNGKLFYVRIVSHATVFGKHKARVVVAIDIDEQVQAQKKMQISESKLNGLINNTDDLIWMIDKAGLVVAANDAFKEKFRIATGFPLAISKKIDVSKLPNTWMIENWRNYIGTAFGGKKLRIEQDIETLGKMECFEILLNPVYNDAGEVFSVGCFARDISHRKDAENKIKEQVKKLKDVAWIQSHEVRRPLANILGLLDLIRNASSDPKSNKELFDHMESSCNELDAMIKKIVETTATENTSST